MSDVDGRGASLEFERGRRALYLRMGMILCLFLVLMDRPLSPAHSSVPSSSSTSKASSSSKEEGSHILKGLFFDPALAAHINAFTPSIDFGHNVTGTYRALVNGRQRAVVHLRSTPIVNIPSLQFVFGIAKLTSAEGEGKNGIFPLQGVLLSLSSEEGELTLMASPLYRQHFAIQVSHNLTRSSVNSNGSVSTIRIASNQTTSLPSAKINTSQALNISTRPSSPPSFTTGIRGLEGKMRLVAFSLDELDGNATDDRNNRNSLLGAQWGDFSSSSLLSFNEDLLLPPSFQSLLHPNAPPKTSSSCTFSAVMRASFADRSHLFLSPSSSGTSDNNVLASQLDGTFFAKDCPAAQFNVTAESSLHSAELLERKVHVYVTLALLLCVLQIAFFVVQLRHSALANTMAKISILSLSAGALLDSLLCCVHLMLCTAFQKFSAHFLAIAVLQMLLFSVFGMRAVVAVYQSRFAQDFASEGSVGLRRRLTLLHARFYLALFVITLLLYASNLSPLCLLLLYSVWLVDAPISSISL